MIKKKLFILPFIFCFYPSIFSADGSYQRGYPRYRNRRFEDRRYGYRRQQRGYQRQEEVASPVNEVTESDSRDDNVPSSIHISTNKTPKDYSPFMYSIRQGFGLVLGLFLGAAATIGILKAGWLVYIQYGAEEGVNPDVLEAVHENIIRKLLLGARNE